MSGWGLEVVRGRSVGRVYPLAPAEAVLGSGPGGEAGMDLAGEEGSSPRRMAPRQAVIELTEGGPVLRDLDSPGGTFVNRQRVLPGEARRLNPGDVLQLGSVQLRVVETAPAGRPVPPPAKPSPAPAPAPASAPIPTPAATVSAFGAGLPRPFTLANGAACRKWDDFLTVSAQHWAALRDEMESGRLAEFLRSIGRDDLRPAPAGTGAGVRTPDERLDAWLGRLPALRAAAPDLEVHPETVRVRAAAGGGTTRAKVVVTNTGYRLLRSTVRVEPAGTSWVRVAGGLDGAAFTTAEATEVPLEIDLPEETDAPKVCAVVVDSNGGTRRVEVRAEPAARPEEPWGGPVEPEPAPAGAPVFGALAGVPLGARVVGAAAAGVAARVLVGAGDRLATAFGGSSTTRPALAGVAVLAAAIGGVAGAWWARRRGEPRDAAPLAFSGAYAGVLVSALAVAVCRAAEPQLGMAHPGAIVGPSLVWAALGVAAALASWRVAPAGQADEGGSGS